MQQFPIDSYSNENFISPFFRPQEAANPRKGRKHIRNESTPARKLWRKSARGLSRNRWPNKQTNKCVSRTDTNPPFAFDIAFFRASFHLISTGGTGTVKKVHTLLIWLFLAVAEIRSLQMVKNSWAHPVETAWPTWMALCQNVRRSVSYIRDRTWRRSGKQKR